MTDNGQPADTEENRDLLLAGGLTESHVQHPHVVPTFAAGHDRGLRSHGMLHRDVKPANLLVDDCGQLWVTDFGLARFQGGGTT